ncbi:ECF transporter S component [Peptoniphilus sp. MSJ-1]|uniref:ECF transporter S component n=1 Tax=Peptoniphilus ovalis TaxID=2841503 RepID=A0ABS6FIZ9_9FIRM|nr:ECF transporter S component [Peptoniphilus ovalis]MBU5670150.1 ECF transporter S component [Peptoniphilus ovalis]
MKINTKTLTMLALCVAINMAGSMIGVLVKIPVYLDSIGTIMAGFTFGPIFGLLTGVITAFVNTIGDPVALYFMPTQLIVGFTAGYFTFLKKDDVKSKFYLTPVMSIPAAISSALIATYLFGTVTTAGSSYIVQAIRAVVDFPDFLVVLVIQIITDYADKLISILLVSKVYNMNAFQNLIKN